MNNLNFRWSRNNTKIRKLKGVIAFSLPAVKTCPGAGLCKSICYAMQGRYTTPNVIQSREHNRKLLDKRNRESMLASDLSRLKAKIIRLHDSGDFYNQSYFDLWCRIAKSFPDKTFYAYTKSLHLNLSQAPKNLRLVQSLGGRHDAKADPKLPIAAVCPPGTDLPTYTSGNESDAPAINGIKRIKLSYHGTKKLNPKIAKALRCIPKPK